MLEGLIMGRRKSLRDTEVVTFTQLPSTSFITATNLRGQLNFSMGIVNEPVTWLQFTLVNGKTIVVPKVMITDTVSWKDLYDNALARGTKRAYIQGKIYSVRLLHCSPNNGDTIPGVAGGSLSIAATAKSELYDVLNSVRASRPADFTGKKLAEFTDAELQGSRGGFQYAWELMEGNPNQCPLYAVSLGGIFRPISGTDSSDSSRGWRPVLELLGEMDNLPVAMEQVAPADFITAAALRSLVNLTVGTGYEPAFWMRFTLKNGKVLLVPNIPITANLNWKNLNDLGIARGKTVTIRGRQYNLRLLHSSPSGGDTMPGVKNGGVSGTQESEWYHLFNSVRAARPAIYSGARLAELSDDVLKISTTQSTGVFQYAWELLFGDSSQATLLAIDSGGLFRPVTGTDSADDTRGWRPVLELIP